MKIAISAQGPGLDAQVDPRFGRARWLVIYDTESKQVESLDNSTNYNAAQGAGIKAAELVAAKDCAAVLTGHLGPKAFAVLKKAEIKGYNEAGGKVKDAIADYQQGKLQEIFEADVQGHW